MKVSIGIIYPADGQIDDEFWQIAPPDVVLLITRTNVPKAPITASLVRELAGSPDIEQSALLLAQSDADIIAYGCTSISFSRGYGGDRDIINRIERTAHRKATTSSTGCIAALRALGAKTVAICAPYYSEITTLLAQFLTDHGFEITTTKSLDLPAKIMDVSAAQAASMILSANTPATDAIFVSCTNLRTLDVIIALSDELNKPVISANLVTIWHALDLIGYTGPLTPALSLINTGRYLLDKETGTHFHRERGNRCS